MASSRSINPSFVCSSGELLWGQLHCIVEGHLTNTGDGQFEVPEPMEEGNIIQTNYQYCVKAARGRWDVGQITSRCELDKPPFVAGFIVYNSELVDPVSIVKCCAEVGMSTMDDDGDKSIVYINRYDWSWAHEIPEETEKLLYADVTEDMEKSVRRMMGKRLILADASDGLAIINQLKQNLTNVSKNCLIKQTLLVDNRPIGVHLSCPDTEYELGWMVFNSSDPKELIAFVYDGAYSLLEGELILNENTCIRSATEWQSEIDGRQKSSEEFRANHNAALEAKDVKDLATIFNNRNKKTAEAVAEELLQANFQDVPITSDLLDPYRNTIADLQRIIEILEEKKKSKFNEDKL